jgi:subtilisin family serine protease
MRFLIVLLAALALATPVRAADPARELVVQLSAAAVSAPVDGANPAHVRAQALPSAVRARLATLGLRSTRALTEPATRTGPLAARRALPEEYGFHPERIVLVEAADSTLALAAQVVLAHDPLVDWVERNTVRRVALWSLEPNTTAAARPTAASTLDSLANDPALRDGRQYALHNVGPSGPYRGTLRADVHALEAWRVSVGDDAIKLAVADTGIDPAQPELGGLLRDGSPRLVDAFNATDDPDPSVIDLYGHGTPVAGVMAARTGDGAPFTAGAGVAGVCGGDGLTTAGCSIVPIKIAPGHSGEAATFDIARALLHAADVGARAVNLSFASTGPSRTERLALTYALFNGCIPVSAAGNSGFDTPTLPLFPAAYASDGLTISVGASDPNDRRTLFSSYPSSLDLLAPGENVFTTFMTYPSFFGARYNGYVPASGTSFAAPHVTGAIGLLAAARPDLTDTDFQHVIRESAHDLPPVGRDAPTAWGRLDLERMLARVGPGVGLWHDEVAADSFAVTGEGLLTVLENGTGTLGAHLGSSWATRLAATATIAIPDSFLSVTSVWLRVAGTMAARGDFRIPYFSPSAEVVAFDDRRAAFRGFLYRVNEDSCATCDDAYVPLPPTSVRFAYSVLGPVDRAPTLAVTAPDPDATGTPGEPLTVTWRASDPDRVTRVQVAFEPALGGQVELATVDGALAATTVTLPCLGPTSTAGRLVVTALDEHGHADRTRVTRPFTLAGGTCSAPLATFRVTPTPFTGSLGVFAPGAGRVQVLDASGRRVRELTTAGGPVQWDGRDADGGPVAAGLYFVRFTGAAGTATRRVVRLAR